MKYTMKSDRLYTGEQVAARIEGTFIDPEKRVLSPEGRLLLRVDIRSLEAPRGRQGDVRFREYVMTDGENIPFAVAKPDYAEGDDPMVTGWPCCRMPRVDHAQVEIENVGYCLAMVNSENYLMKKQGGEKVLEISHRGLVGGWDIEAADELCAELICGIFIFCRYIERENEFLIV